MAKYAIITSFLGELRDRFCLYNTPRSIAEKLETAAGIPGITGVEMIYPYDFQDFDPVASALRRLNLGVAAVNINVKGEREFIAGSLTSSDPDIRAKAVRFLHEGMDAAAALGCDKVTVCPLSDGYDYAFQADYAGDWRRLRDAFGEAAARRPEIMLCLEYKPNETRVRSTLSDAHATILLIRELGSPNLGITVDLGHALYAGETPARTLSMLTHYGIRPYIHLNDNYRNWDWDLMPGSVNIWDTLEFLWTANAIGYDDWFTFDVFPSRMDPAACFAVSAKMLTALQGIAHTLDPAELNEYRSRGDTPGLIGYVWRRAGLLS